MLGHFLGCLGLDVSCLSPKLESSQEYLQKQEELRSLQLSLRLRGKPRATWTASGDDDNDSDLDQRQRISL